MGTNNTSGALVLQLSVMETMEWGRDAALRANRMEVARSMVECYKFLTRADTCEIQDASGKALVRVQVLP